MNRDGLRNSLLALTAVLVAGLVALPATLVAETPARGGGMAVASAVVYAGGVDFMPTVRHSGGVVTISGNGMVFQRAIEPGAGLSIGVFDPAGQLLPDGVYKWELELYPDARTAKKLKAAAALNSGRAPGAWQRHTGNFAIRNGLVAAPDLVEAGPEPNVAAAAVPENLAGPSAARGPAGDDDAAVGFGEGVEAATRAALAAQPQAAALAKGELSERSDAAAIAVGGSLEPVKPAAAGPALGEVQPVRRSMFDNSENGANGRDRSNQR